mmetsp:Transcript_45453/g.74211  ORF Transcript_45453/g.74211 Transcript_45453/m.74211 type:complete len:244 (-) Transcript_45453:2285-3016(-)
MDVVDGARGDPRGVELRDDLRYLEAHDDSAAGVRRGLPADLVEPRCRGLRLRARAARCGGAVVRVAHPRDGPRWHCPLGRPRRVHTGPHLPRGRVQAQGAGPQARYCVHGTGPGLRRQGQPMGQVVSPGEGPDSCDAGDPCRSAWRDLWEGALGPHRARPLRAGRAEHAPRHRREVPFGGRGVGPQLPDGEEVQAVPHQLYGPRPGGQQAIQAAGALVPRGRRVEPVEQAAGVRDAEADDVEV